MKSSIRAALSKAKGFTLIELLIVIAIIAILTVAFLPTLRGGQASARNATRKAATNDIALAIERIANGDLPAGVTLSVATAGAIPNRLANGSYSGCLTFASGLGSDIRAVLGRTPVVDGTNTTLCTGGYWYKAFKSGGAVVSADADTVVNYMIATQVELPVSSGNVSGTFPAGGFTDANMNTHFTDWAEVLTNASGTPTTALWVITK